MDDKPYAELEELEAMIEEEESVVYVSPPSSPKQVITYLPTHVMGEDESSSLSEEEMSNTSRNGYGNGRHPHSNQYQYSRGRRGYYQKRGYRQPYHQSNAKYRGRGNRFHSNTTYFNPRNNNNFQQQHPQQMYHNGPHDYARDNITQYPGNQADGWNEPPNRGFNG